MHLSSSHPTVSGQSFAQILLKMDMCLFASLNKSREMNVQKSQPAYTTLLLHTLLSGVLVGQIFCTLVVLLDLYLKKQQSDTHDSTVNM